MNDLHLLSIILLSISSSIDNFGVGISYGMRNVCLPLSLNLFIAFLNSIGTFVSMVSGQGFSRFTKPTTAGYLGALLLIIIGASIVAMEFRKKSIRGLAHRTSSTATAARKKTALPRIALLLDDPFGTGVLCSGQMAWKEGLILGLALTLSNISTGVAAGMMGFSPALTTGAAFLFNFLALYGGERIGHYTSARIIKDISGITAGLLLVFIGLYEILG